MGTRRVIIAALLPLVASCTINIPNANVSTQNSAQVATAVNAAPATAPIVVVVTPAPTPSPAASSTPAPTPTPEPGCDMSSAPESAYGMAWHGAYRAFPIPKGWETLENARMITAAIESLRPSDWPCFQVFYPDAARVYLESGRKPPGQ